MNNSVFRSIAAGSVATSLMFALGLAAPILLSEGPLTTHDQTTAPVIHFTEWTPPENVIYRSGPIMLEACKTISAVDALTNMQPVPEPTASNYDAKGEVMWLVWQAECRLVQEN